MRPKYVHPFTGFGFKKIFGEEENKVLLIDFLNSLLPEDTHICDLTFEIPEQLGAIAAERIGVCDIYCENDKREKIIVELQMAKHNFFEDRTAFYSTFPIREMAEKGTDWAFDLKAVFCIGVLDFVFNDYATKEETKEVIHEIKLRKPNGKVFYNKLTYIYLEMPNFTKTNTELSSRLDKWLYFIKHLEDFQSIPEIFKGEVVFHEAFEKAELANLTEEEYQGYEQSKKVYRDLKGVIDTAYQKGVDEEKMTIATRLKHQGIALQVIATATGLTLTEIERL